MDEFLKAPVLAALERSGRPLKAKELARDLEIRPARYRAFREFLRGLVDAGELYRVKQGRYAPPDRINLVVGILSVTRQGGGWVAPDKGGDDVHVPSEELATAQHGDKVVVRVETRRRGRPEGRVVRILERARSEFIGTLRRTEHFALVHVDDPRFRSDVYVPLPEAGDARDGEKVMVAVLDWGSPTATPVGRIAERLGMPDDPGLEVLMIVKNRGLPTTFPPEVEAAAAELRDDVPAEEIAKRLDLRDTMIVTIDPPTARDFDDALSLDEDADGNLVLGVHIADVSHYVRHDDVLDREAWSRGTSVYLVDRVIPMLPEKLSNELCSLNPDVDRLAMSVLATLTPRGKLVGYRIEDTVIRSSRRLTYEAVQAAFDGDAKVRAELKPVLGLLERLRALASVLNQKRVRRGALDFDLPESRVLLDEEGFPIDIQKVVRTESNRLVEEFMLLANEIVARHLKESKIPAVFRVHEEPREEKLDELAGQIGPFGYVFRPGKDGRVPPKELQRVLKEAEEKPEEAIVHTLVLRSLMRARYDVFPLGHYGLALKDYTHFTSPIRRYPDLLVHRILRMQSGRQRKAMPDEARYREWLDAACVRSSEREQLAESAERDSVELKKIQFMERHLGDEFDGVISGVQAFGFFVELERYHVSGLVHVNNLGDDYYEYWEEAFSLVGANTGRRFRLGDRVRVQVLAVKRELRQIDFVLLTDETALPDVTPAQRMRRARAVFEGTAREKRPPSRLEERDARRRGRGSKAGVKRAETAPAARGGSARTSSPDRRRSGGGGASAGGEAKRATGRPPRRGKKRGKRK